MAPMCNYHQSQGTPLSHDKNSGVIVSNRSLVIQRITVANAGNYHCLASNRHGAGKSNPVNLSVRCERDLDLTLILETDRVNLLL